MKVEVSLPSLLADSAGGKRRFTVEADTLAGALAAMLEAHPLLRPHLYDEAMRTRKHVLIFFNDENVATLPMEDSSTFIRSVRGGRYGKGGPGLASDLGDMKAETKACDGLKK